MGAGASAGVRTEEIDDPLVTQSSLPGCDHLTAQLDNDEKAVALIAFVKRLNTEELLRYAHLIGWPTIQLRRRKIDGALLLKLGESPDALRLLGLGEDAVNVVLHAREIDKAPMKKKLHNAFAKVRSTNRLASLSLGSLDDSEPETKPEEEAGEAERASADGQQQSGRASRASRASKTSAGGGDVAGAGGDGDATVAANDQTGAGEMGAGNTGAGETGAFEPGAAEPGAGKTGAAETGAAETGTGDTAIDAPASGDGGGGSGDGDGGAPAADGDFEAIAGAEKKRKEDAELNAAAEAEMAAGLVPPVEKYEDPEKVSRALEWVRVVCKQTVTIDPSLSFGEALKSGLPLSYALNNCKPGAVSHLSTSKSAYHQRNNVLAFLEAAKAFGVPDGEMFEATHLLNCKNLDSVATTIYALARVARGLGKVRGLRHCDCSACWGGAVCFTPASRRGSPPHRYISMSSQVGGRARLWLTGRVPPVLPGVLDMAPAYAWRTPNTGRSRAARAWHRPARARHPRAARPGRGRREAARHDAAQARSVHLGALQVGDGGDPDRAPPPGGRPGGAQGARHAS